MKRSHLHTPKQSLPEVCLVVGLSDRNYEMLWPLFQVREMSVAGVAATVFATHIISKHGGHFYLHVNVIYRSVKMYYVYYKKTVFKTE